MVQRPIPTKTVPSALLAAGFLPIRSTACDRSISISTAHHASSASPEKSTSSKWTKILVCTSTTALLRILACVAVSLFGSVDLSLSGYTNLSWLISFIGHIVDGVDQKWRSDIIQSMTVRRKTMMLLMWMWMLWRPTSRWAEHLTYGWGWRHTGISCGAIGSFG